MTALSQLTLFTTSCNESSIIIKSKPDNFNAVSIDILYELLAKYILSLFLF